MTIGSHLRTAFLLAAVSVIPCQSSYHCTIATVKLNLLSIHQVLSVESCSEGIVRTLKLFELLTENVSYSKLMPGLLTSVASAVRPYVTYPGEWSAPLHKISLVDGLHSPH